MVPQWRALGQILGWPVALVSESHIFSWNFASFDRLLEEPPTFEAKRDPWVHGYARDRRVIVRSMPFYASVSDSAFMRAMAASDRDTPPPPVHTIAMAEIDPPIFAGLQLVTRPSGRFGPPRLFGQMPIARADLAGQLWATAHDAARVNALFSLGVPELLLREGLRQGANIAMHDGVVEVSVMGVPNAAVLHVLVDWAASLGVQLSMLSNELPLRMADVPWSRGWAKVASERGLVFHPKRWLSHGTIGGVALEARLETGHGTLATSVRAKLRSPLACGISLRKALVTERPSFFQRALGTVFVGERAFDDDFVIFAVDPDAARERLSRPGVTDALRALADGATQVLVDDASVFVSDDGCSDATLLARRIDAVRAVVAALNPVVHGGAYR